MALKAGDWVEVRSKDEILETLDENGRLEEMPFTPQMLQYCGQRFRVQKRAHKTCDPVYSLKARSLSNAVHLSLRCDGKAYGGCQMGCLLFWQEAWLKPVADANGVSTTATEEQPQGTPVSLTRCTEEDVWKGTRVNGGTDETDARYVCQTTQLPAFTKPLAWWNPAQYIEDITSGNATLGDLLRGAFYVLLGRRRARRFPIVRRVYNRVQALTGGLPSPYGTGHLPVGQAQPISSLDLQPGEFVRVKSHDEILDTLNTNNTHRGLYFDVEMVPYCGSVHRVRSRVARFIDEKTGRMRSLKTPAVILESAFCTSRYSSCRMFCPRALFSWWREEWLERVNEKTVFNSGIGETGSAPRDSGNLTMEPAGALK